MSNLNENFKVKNGLTVNTTISAGSCIEGDSFKKHGGTSSQFLKANGSVDSTSYVSDFDTGGDGLTYDVSDKTSILIELDSTVVRTSGNQTLAGDKCFTGNILSAGVDLDQLFGSGGGGSGTITEVVAGTGLTGGGTTGSVTLNLSAGDGVEATANCVSVDSTVVRTTGVQGIAGVKNFTSTICANGGTTTVDAFTLTSSDEGSDAAPIQTFKRNTCSAADGDYLGQIKFRGQNQSGQEVNYAKITGKISDATGSTEDGLMEFAVQKAGSMTIVSRHTHDALKLINGTGLEVAGTSDFCDNIAITGDSTTSGTAVVTNLSAATICSNDVYCNTAIGNNALVSNTTGCNNVAIGVCSSYSQTTGARNVSIGENAHKGATTGSYNVTIGSQAGFYALSGDHNMAMGQYALYDNWGGDYNTAIGTASMQCNTTGSNNAALGYRSMMNNTTGNDNFAVGECALQSNVNGIGNTALGQNALGNSVTGNYSVAIGSNAGAYQANGCTTLSAASDSIYIGRNTKGKDNNDNNSIVIGYNACSCGQNTVKIGNNSVTAACVQVAWTAVSDERDKTDITDLNHGLEFIGDLKPKAFKYRKTRTSTANDGICRYGFLAQDIQETEDGDKVIVSESNPEQLGLNSDYLVPILVKAVQELEARVAELEG
jgi:hypothetical protein